MLPRKRALDLALTLAAVAVLTVACAGGKPIDVGPPGGGGDDDDDGLTGSFAQEAYPAIASLDCGSAACHSNANQAVTGGLELPNVAMTMTTGAAFAEISAETVVNTADPPASLLLTKGEGVGHTGGILWDDNDSEYEAVLFWIEQGAANN